LEKRITTLTLKLAAPYRYPELDSKHKWFLWTYKVKDVLGCLVCIGVIHINTCHLPNIFTQDRENDQQDKVPEGYTSSIPVIVATCSGESHAVAASILSKIIGSRSQCSRPNAMFPHVVELGAQSVFTSCQTLEHE